ncbi:MAG: hypothetical protein RL722_2261, partial [Pseudomonadota bacterium]
MGFRPGAPACLMARQGHFTEMLTSSRLRFMRCLQVLAGGLLSALVACGGGGGGGGTDAGPRPGIGPAAANPYFPTQAGSRWYYERSGNLRPPSTFKVEAGASTLVNGRQAAIFTVTEDVGSTETHYFSTSAQQVLDLAGTDGAALVDQFTVLLLPDVGDQPYVQFDAQDPDPLDADGDLRPDPTHLHATASSARGGVVITPAGQFSDTVLQTVQTQITVTSTRLRRNIVLQQTEKEWYASGVGLIKVETTITSEAGVFQETQVLHTYAVGSRRSESTPPQMFQPDGPPQTVSGPGLVAGMAFSEEMYLPTLQRPGAVQLRNASGDPQTFTLSLDTDPKVVLLQPSGTLSSGLYTLEVAASVEDLAGNVMGKVAGYQFIVDSDAPGIVAVKPPDQAIGVRTDTVPRIDLTEPLSRDGRSELLIHLLDDTGAVVPSLVSGFGNSVQIFPSSRLQPGRTYTLSIDPGLADFWGNAAPLGFQSRFTTDPDTLPPSVEAMQPAQGSTGADPMAPVVVTLREPIIDSNLIFGFGLAPMAPGSSEIPARVSVDASGRVLTLTPNFSLPWDTEIQVNLPALQDLAGNFSQPQVAGSFRTARGLFPPAQVLNIPLGFISSVAIGDLNGDGHPDLAYSVLTDFAADQIMLRTSLPGGGLAEPVPLPLPAGCGSFIAMRKLMVADLNGDGRGDLIASSPICGVFVHLQQADGSLAPGQNLLGGVVDHLEIKDMNGDGRPDLVTLTGASLEIWSQQADGSFSSRQQVSLPITDAADIAVGDLDDNGRPDIAVAAGRVGVLRQDGQGGLAPIDWVEPNFLFAAWSLAIGDLNGDGRPDLAVGAGGNLPNTALRIYHQQPGGQLAPPLDLPTYQIPNVLRLADVDGDGRLDVVISHLAYFRVGIYLQGAQGLGSEQL